MLILKPIRVGLILLCACQPPSANLVQLKSSNQRYDSCVAEPDNPSPGYPACRDVAVQDAHFAFICADQESDDITFVAESTFSYGFQLIAGPKTISASGFFLYGSTHADCDVPVNQNRACEVAMENATDDLRAQVALMLENADQTDLGMIQLACAQGGQVPVKALYVSHHRCTTQKL